MDADPQVKDYRADIQNAWLRAHDGTDLLKGDVLMHLTFWFQRPSQHYRPVNSKRSTPELKADAPMYYRRYPDLDKLVRAVGDALTGYAYLDDKQVVQCHAAKVWGEQDQTIIEVMSMEEHDAEQ